MYTIKAFVDGKEYMIHNPRVKALIVGDPYYQKGDNVNGQAEFSVYPTHPYYQYVKKLTTDIVFYKDGVEKFAGRVLYDDEDSKGVKKVFVEGELAYFCDSIQRPTVYHNISVKNYLKTIIDNHNSQVEERKQFTLGRVSVTDQNDSLYRYANWETTRETLKDKLVDRLGGHLVIRKKDGIRYLDYLNDDEFYTQNRQEIRFGKNLLDYSKNMDASDLVTCVIPLGTKLEKSSIEGLEERLTIKEVNGGVDYVSDDSAVAAYGRIYKTVTWDDVKVASNLMKKGREYLKSVQFENMVLELKAIDLNLTDDDIQELEVGDLIRCVSPPHGLDSKLPLSSLKVYISNFAKNTITLGTEKQSNTYTSSNSHTAEKIEKTINSMPSKGEILQEALRDATNLLNDMNRTGNAIHTKNEFIVSDTPGVANAKNLWRWGLGGLAHYSEGYDGPIDGVALTMDGKINGKMISAGSIYAESIDIGYRKQVESTISDAVTAAENYADGQVEAAKQTIETSITNLENRINLSVSSTKEIVARKNYVTSGEEETLDISSFTVSGSYATVEEAECLNQKCLKLIFESTGTVYINQDLGTLPEGNYKIAVQVAFATAAERPAYITYGFSGNQSTEYFKGYTAGEYHVFSKEVSVTKASKTVSIGIYGSVGNVCYLTNIRCLRDIQELLDDLDTSFTVGIGEVRAMVADVFENSQHNYCSNGDFSNTDDYFTDWYRSSDTRITKETVDGVSCAKLESDLTDQTYLRYSINNAKCGPFYVRFKAACDAECESTAQICVDFGGTRKYIEAGQLTTSFKTFSFEFEIPEGMVHCFFYNTEGDTAVYITDIEILGYASSYTETALAVLKDSILTEVSKKVGKTEIVSSINQTAEKIKITASKISLEGLVTANTNFRILEDGSMEARNGKFTGTVTGSTIQTGENGDRVLIDRSSAIKGCLDDDVYNLLDFMSDSETHEMILDAKNMLAIRTPKLAVMNKSYGLKDGEVKYTKNGSTRFVTHVEKDMNGCVEQWVGSVYCTLPVKLRVQYVDVPVIHGMQITGESTWTSNI
jgi:hypothetical protein